MNNWMKWIYTFVLLGLTVYWAIFLISTVKCALAEPTEINILETTGVSVLLGALIAWNATVNQHWFRKKDAE